MPAEVGQPAPDFTLDAHDGTQVTLSSFRADPAKGQEGQNVAGARFPRAKTDRQVPQNTILWRVRSG